MIKVHKRMCSKSLLIHNSIYHASTNFFCNEKFDFLLFNCQKFALFAKILESICTLVQNLAKYWGNWSYFPWKIGICMYLSLMGITKEYLKFISWTGPCQLHLPNCQKWNLMHKLCKLLNFYVLTQKNVRPITFKFQSDWEVLFLNNWYASENRHC